MYIWFEKSFVGATKQNLQLFLVEGFLFYGIKHFKFLQILDHS